jgi:uncharacterized protein YndB with AHSA1/START domain
MTAEPVRASIRGHYVELDPPHRLVVSWGYAGSEELPPGASTVEVCLVRDGTGTRVHLEHRDLPAPEEPGYATGWTYYLAHLAAASPPPDSRTSGASRSQPHAKKIFDGHKCQCGQGPQCQR